ncbi:MAG: acyl-CoA synthetase FdrA [Candidatus Cloacimonetes bacterium]|jgi:succinyl-CoA synthetase alpha subunit|nr:acyl-CoA synthetase FdrA [Candidatus Cloacimonadota bacterium]
MIKSLVKKGEYFDSVSLMIVGKDVAQMNFVQDATVVMATQENKSILKTANLYLDEFEQYDATDLLIVIKSDNEEKFDEIFKNVDILLKEIRNKEDDQGTFNPRSLESAIQIQPESNIALISLAGRYAGAEAMKALKSGLNVMLFSDNVPIEIEIKLKKYALENDLLMMGPDCGTAIINGVPLAFSNAVNKGNIGIIAASGTGLQEVSSIISEEGFGISQAIGTGGRDIKKQIGGMMFISSLDALEDDENTEVIVLVSKPPHPEVLKRINEKLREISKPVICVFLGADSSLLEDSGTFTAETLEEAALLACAVVDNVETSKVKEFLEERRKDFGKIVSDEVKKISLGRKYIRGLFSGGTLCDEAQIILKKDSNNIFSNRISEDIFTLADSWISKEHTLVDLGEDEFTVGRLHPMIDFDLRNKRILQEANDKETAIILFDLVLGFGANEDPISEILPIIKKAQIIAPDISFICSVTGTEQDPQNRSRIIKVLDENGVIVMPSNAAAAEIVNLIVKKI